MFTLMYVWAKRGKPRGPYPDVCHPSGGYLIFSEEEMAKCSCGQKALKGKKRCAACEKAANRRSQGGSATPGHDPKRG